MLFWRHPSFALLTMTSVLMTRSAPGTIHTIEKRRAKEQGQLRAVADVVVTLGVWRVLEQEVERQQMVELIPAPITIQSLYEWRSFQDQTLKGRHMHSLNSFTAIILIGWNGAFWAPYRRRSFCVSHLTIWIYKNLQCLTTWTFWKYKANQ